MTNDPTQQYLGQGQSRQAFIPYRKPAQVWADYKAMWRAEHGSDPLPSFFNLVGATGIHRDTLRRLVSKDPEYTQMRKQKT